jgi:recombination protein RecT
MAGNLIQQAAQQQTGLTAANEKAGRSINAVLNSILDGEKMRGRFNELLGKRTPQFLGSMVSMINADANLQQAFYSSR